MEFISWISCITVAILCAIGFVHWICCSRFFVRNSYVNESPSLFGCLNLGKFDTFNQVLKMVVHCPFSQSPSHQFLLFSITRYNAIPNSFVLFAPLHCNSQACSWDCEMLLLLFLLFLVLMSYYWFLNAPFPSFPCCISHHALYVLLTIVVGSISLLLKTLLFLFFHICHKIYAVRPI